MIVNTVTSANNPIITWEGLALVNILTVLVLTFQSFEVSCLSGFCFIYLLFVPIWRTQVLPLSFR